jgi:DUF4097 and DUF4098 domain-containing protein YvlB
MKGNAIVRIVIYSVAIVTLLGILLSATAANLYFSTSVVQAEVPAPTESPREISQYDFTPQIQNIEIDWVAGSIAIHKSDSLSNIIVEELSPAESQHNMVVKQSGQTLKIEFAEDHVKFDLFSNNKVVSKDLVIRVPKNWNCNNLEIDAAATDVTIQDLTIRELDFDGASGNLILDHCNITDLDIDTASGDIEFVGTLDNLDFDAASAKFYGEFYNSPRSLEMDSMSGDLELVLPEYTGFELNMETVSGSFDTDFTFGKHNDLYICGDGNCKINVSAMSSDVSILKGITAGKNCDH